MHLLLAAGVQAVHVVNNPALHVRVVNGQDPVAVTGLRVAIAALIVAIVTLGAVGYQIYLARQELEAVKTDLANNTTQFNEFMRRPNLVISIESVWLISRGTEAATYGVQLALRNKGDRASPEHLVELLLPKAATRMNLPERTVNSIAYLVSSFSVTQDTVFQNDIPLYQALQYIFHPGSVVKGLWRVYDEYGTYPKDEYGRFSFVAPAE